MNEQELNNKLFNKYKNIFSYVDTILFSYLTGKKKKDVYLENDSLYEKKYINLDRFRRISMDYDDLKHEVYLDLIPILQKYEKKYKNIDKVKLPVYVKKIIFLKIKNIFRDNKNKIFLPLPIELEKEEVKNSSGNSIEFDTSYTKEVELVHPDLIPDNVDKPKLTTDDIKRIIKSIKLSEIDRKLLELKIIENYSFVELKKHLGLNSRQAAKDKYNRAIRKLKKKYKNLSQLFDK